MGKTCPNCKSSDFDVDPSRGDTVCMGCGSVLEENRIVSEVSIQENADGSASVVGQFVASEGSYKPYLSGFQYGMGKDSRQISLDKGRDQIREMAALLNLNRHCTDTAFNFYKMAVAKRLSRGRRIKHIVAACLYMTCRTEGTPHMLLDFSDVTQVNVFTLGKVFLLLAKEFHINLPILGYLGKKYENSSGYPANSTYWNPSINEHWNFSQSRAPSTAHSWAYAPQDISRPISYPQLTDEYNMKTSSRANTFSATTRVREVPVAGVFKKEIQEFRSRTPSARGVRAAALTSRSLVASQKASSIAGISVAMKSRGSSEQPSRLMKEHKQLQLTRERKRQAQISSHRIDRMYYMHGASTKIHPKYEISEDELTRLRAIAIARGVPLLPSNGYKNKKSASTISGPHSTPRGPNDDEDDLARMSSARTIIPTADNLSLGGDAMSTEGADVSDVRLGEKQSDSASDGKEDRATSDNEGDEFKDYQNGPLDEQSDTEVAEKLSVKSESALSKQDKNVTFLTELETSGRPEEVKTAE